ncbi:chemotaxis protein CheW [Sphingobium jiangsuense]|uniref:Purine-binding chemotaxis protein CheW n=1 Tax=Sphingobium jiangsuense TaxID=870476 RepID=A0A7W6BER6_9SPHN|nr:chemotaxis protein CheW [Sphingobium jiangsuense]MBB3924754.1 purine-binding chemotaxis protein CheW [Sphingobium jiangsuense]GLT00394.1 chemotaxis protein CheW [Sphingobium jiangsuense]
MARQLITFRLGEQSFGLDIMAIREIRAWSPATRLPHVPPYVAGVVNLRGTVLPVIDLAARLGWEPANPTDRHVIIVAQVGTQLRGLIVDAVSDIVTAQEEEMQPAPATGSDAVVPYLEGLLALEDRMVMVLDLPGLTADAVLPEAA